MPGTKGGWQDTTLLFLGRMRKAIYFRPTKSSLAERPVSPFQGEPIHDVRLHSAIGYVLPRAKLEGRDEAIWAQRRKNLSEANRKRNLENQSEVIAKKKVTKSETLSVATAGRSCKMDKLC